MIGTESEVSNLYSRRKFLKRILGLSGCGEDVSLKRTAVESVGFTIVNAVGIGIIQAELGKVINKEFGNRGMTDETLKVFQKNPVQMFKELSIAAPLKEEPIFRIIPSVFTSLLRGVGIMWRVGIPSSALFAAAHNVEVDRFGVSQMTYNVVPLPQFTSGLFNWKMLRERGYLHAILAHSVNNTIAGILFLSQGVSKLKGDHSSKSLPPELV